MYAKKSLGQHFLKSDKALKSIVDAGEVCTDDLILEIGPGMGSLTEKLLPLACKVIAVEKDDQLFEHLQGNLKNNKLEIVHGDILDFDLSSLEARSYKLIANIPYNITGAILRKFLSADYQPERMVLLVQKEVAERIVAKNKNPSDSTQGKESVLSISVKVYGTPRYVETVKAGSFAPMPKVDSAILLIENISKEFFTNFSETDFFSILKTGFSSKRKKLSSNLSTKFPKEKVLLAFASLGINENIRAENLNIETWRNLASKLI